jgi:hypothetical protein
MNHQNIYNSIIKKAQLENRKKYCEIYYEEHHIKPKCLNGSNEENNKVLLTSREHFVCHKLLTYIYKGNIKIGCAFFRMAYDKQNRKVSSRDYAYAKEISRLDMNGEKNPMYKKTIYDIWEEKYGKEIANVKRLQNKQKRKGKKRTDIVWNKGKKCPQLATMKGKHHSEETKLKIKKGNEKKIVSEKTKNKQRLSMKGKYKEYIWIHDNSQTKFIPKYDLQKFIQYGWNKGRK